MTLRSIWLVLGVGGALAGCASVEPATHAPPPTIAPPPKETSGSGSPDADTVTSSYVDFWNVSRSTGNLPDQQWRSRLSDVAADPLLPRLVEGFSRQRDDGVSLYGAVTARVSEVTVTDSRARVTDCQDASHAGRTEPHSQKPKTVGVSRNPVVGTLERAADGRWRVIGIDYPGGAC